MPTQVQGLGLVDDQGNKSIVVNLSNARQMTNAEYQQLTPAQRNGAIIVTDFPIPEDEDKVEVTGDGTKTIATLLAELYALVDFNKINKNSVMAVGSTDSSYFRLVLHRSNELRFGAVYTNGSSQVYAASLRLKSSAADCLYVENKAQSSGNTITSRGNDALSNGSKIIIYYGTSSETLNLLTDADHCMMSDGETSVESAIGAIKGVNSATFSGNTDVNGNCIISSSRSVLNARVESSGNYTSYVFYYAPTATWYVHVMDVSGNKQSGVSVYGTYYYIN